MIQETALAPEDCSSYEISQNLNLNFLNSKVSDLLRLAPRLAIIDSCTENITRPLRSYPNGIAFEDLGNRGHNPSRPDGAFSLNTEVVFRIQQSISKQDLLRLALLIYLFHEAAHSSQGLKHYEDVQRMKKVGESIGRMRLSELDLRSDFWAARTLSMFLTVKQYGEYNENRYVACFRHIWCEVCGAMLSIFPPGTREDKQRRVFGYLLMSNLASDAFVRPPLQFCAELWPVWSDDLGWLSIYSNGNLWFPGGEVNRDEMAQILDHISNGNFKDASEGVRHVWSQLRRLA